MLKVGLVTSKRQGLTQVKPNRLTHMGEVAAGRHLEILCGKKGWGTGAYMRCRAVIKASKKDAELRLHKCLPNCLSPGECKRPGGKIGRNIPNMFKGHPRNS
ncbi:hypothetical protein CEXT_505601 [Caerostris extrusa]|uniref:Uncharacterized protein n=1 Tax=Caerostris extrusa TaxID=172846 RepID=A0AAV4X6Y2_CAEEX|nr:hypothetical protein CEXT_505601 [Caerostris extrusa]